MSYTIASAYGVLNVGYLTKDLEIYNGVINIRDSLISNSPKISLRQAAALASKHTKDLSLVTRLCNCNKECRTNSCVCFKGGQKCTSHCHSKSKVTFCVNK